MNLTIWLQIAGLDAGRTAGAELSVAAGLTRRAPSPSVPYFASNAAGETLAGQPPDGGG
jgi:hypothetical protein